MEKQIHPLAEIFPAIDGNMWENQEGRILSSHEWMSHARREFITLPQEPCGVCGKYISVTHAHHIFPLYLQFKCRVSKPIHEIAWLCPTHHAAIHHQISRLIQNRMPEYGGFPPDEVDKMSAFGVKFIAYYKEYIL